jgi:hypothetical protein
VGTGTVLDPSRGGSVVGATVDDEDGSVVVTVVVVNDDAGAVVLTVGMKVVEVVLVEDEGKVLGGVGGSVDVVVVVDGVSSWQVMATANPELVTLSGPNTYQTSMTSPTTACTVVTENPPRPVSMSSRTITVPSMATTNWLPGCADGCASLVSATSMSARHPW